LRRWAILRGEGALTATLTAAGFRPHVLYQTEALRRSLERYSSERIAAEVEALPAKARITISRSWRARSAAGVSPDAARLAGDIADAIHARNQMHYGGFLYRRHLGLPLIKRDIVHRGVYSLPEALANLSDLEPQWLEAIAADLRGRRPPASYGPLRRMLHRHGAI
jgi:hypothetical protein